MTQKFWFLKFTDIKNIMDMFQKSDDKQNILSEFVISEMMKFKLEHLD